MTILQDMIDDDFTLKGRNRWRSTEDHSSLVYDAEQDTFFWNSKDIRGDAYTYLVKVRGLNKEQAQNFLKNSFGGFSEISEIHTHTEPYEKLVEVFWANGINNREYWYKRCLTDDTIDRYKLGYFNEWYLVPIYGNLEFVNFQMRRDEPEKRINNWYKHVDKPLFNEGILPFTDIVYIVEGLVDCILLNQLGFPSVASYGANVWKEEWFEKFSNIPDIYYIEDNDIPGRAGSRLIAKSLGLLKVKIVSFTGRKEKYDTGDWFREGNTKESFKEYINNNSKYLFELEDTTRRKVKRH